MKKYVLQRLLAAIPMVLAVSIVVFILIRLVPGDVAVLMLSKGESTQGTMQDLIKLRAELNLDKPVPEQYGLWLWNAIRGDFGRSFWTGRPIAQEISRTMPVTLELAFLALAISMLIAVPASIISVKRQDRWEDYSARLFSIGGLSIPEFWTGTMLILLPLLWFRWTPPVQFVPFSEDPLKNLTHFMFPAIAGGVALSATAMRLLRASLLEVLRQDYVRTARSKGLAEGVVLRRHALRNALIPVVTLIGIRVGRLVGGTVVLEQIFSLPGMGRLLLDSISFRDYPMVQALVVLFALVYILVNLAVDVSYTWLDPRITYQ